jgi:hypothetical protein
MSELAKLGLEFGKPIVMVVTAELPDAAGDPAGALDEVAGVELAGLELQPETTADAIRTPVTQADNASARLMSSLL